jgi:hypothetical protein
MVQSRDLFKHVILKPGEVKDLGDLKVNVKVKREP